jgi:uncharacterized protein YcbK (DUF882 family)
VEVRRVNGHAAWTGALTDCDGHPTLHGLAAISALASPTHFDALPDLEPIVREIRRVAPAVGWNVIDEHPRRAIRTPCPPGQEPLVAAGADGTADAHDSQSQRTARTRPRSRAPQPSCRTVDVARDPHTHDPMVVLENRVRIVNPRLLTMLDEVTRHFAGHRVEVISGYRPSNDPRAGSRHAHARALDYRLAGIARETLRDFAYTLPLAGVGYYPNSVFIHMDVRDRDEGSARWTDYAGHGESARYGHWPPRDEDVTRETEFLVQQAGRALEALRENENAESEPSTHADDSESAPAAEPDPSPASASSPPAP